MPSVFLQFGLLLILRYIFYNFIVVGINDGIGHLFIVFDDLFQVTIDLSLDGLSISKPYDELEHPVESEEIEQPIYHLVAPYKPY